MDAKVYYENAISGTPNNNTIEMTSLPQGWRAVLTNDGKIYYQNEITKKTQWNRPSEYNNVMNQQTRTTTVNHPINSEQHQIAQMDASNDTDESETLSRRTIWNKDHILWLVLFILNIYDYYTDILVVIVWKESNKVCPQFHCDVVLPFFSKVGWIILLVFSTIGFIGAITLKAIQCKRYYILYKYPLTNPNDLRQREFGNHKYALKFNWIPIILEDLMSATLVFFALFSGWGNVKGTHLVYYQSVAVGLISMFITFIIMTFKQCKYRKEIKKAIVNSEGGVFVNLCYWSCYVGAFGCMYLALVIIFSIFTYLGLAQGVLPVRELYSLQTQHDKAESSDLSISTCKQEQSVYGHPYQLNYDSNDSNNDSIWNILLALNQIKLSRISAYIDCESYTKSDPLLCFVVIGIYDDTFLYYPEPWTIDPVIANCSYDINLGFCGNYTIQCDEWEIQSWACYQYCTI